MELQSTSTIVIEGPGGAGKTTAARYLANHYGYANLNTGSLFRATGAAMLLQGVNPIDLEQFSDESSYDIETAPGQHPLLAVGGRDVSDMLQHPSVTRLAPIIGSHASVAAKLEDRFYMALGLVRHDTRIVVEGKNIGDKVSAAAGNRFYLVASREVRAHRKLMQAQEQGVTDYSLRQALHDTYLNDARDRRLLTIGADTHVIDTSRLTPAEVSETILRLVSNPCEAADRL